MKTLFIFVLTLFAYPLFAQDDPRLKGIKPVINMDAPETYFQSSIAKGNDLYLKVRVRIEGFDHGYRPRHVDDSGHVSKLILKLFQRITRFEKNGDGYRLETKDATLFLEKRELGDKTQAYDNFEAVLEYKSYKTAVFKCSVYEKNMPQGISCIVESFSGDFITKGLYKVADYRIDLRIGSIVKPAHSRDGGAKLRTNRMILSELNTTLRGLVEGKAADHRFKVEHLKQDADGTLIKGRVFDVLERKYFGGGGAGVLRFVENGSPFDLYINDNQGVLRIHKKFRINRNEVDGYWKARLEKLVSEDKDGVLKVKFKGKGDRSGGVDYLLFDPYVDLPDIGEISVPHKGHESGYFKLDLLIDKKGLEN